VNSRTTAKFRELLAAASQQHQEKIRAAYRLWAIDPKHRSLRFKKVHPRLPIYSARIDLDWRAVGVLKDDTLIWFWVGAHSKYEDLLKKM